MIESEEMIMRKKLVTLMLVAVLGVNCLGGCGSDDTKKDSFSEVTEGPSSEAKTTAVSLIRTANSDTVPLNGKDIYMEKDTFSYVKIATIWDPELTLYDAETFVQDSKAIAVTFEVSNMDVEPLTCYWNYMVVDSDENEIACWDTKYQTDDIEITGDGTYQIVFDYSKVEGGVVAGLKSLQLVFPTKKADTTMQVKVMDAVCIMYDAELGTVYKTGAVK